MGDQLPGGRPRHTSTAPRRSVLCDAEGSPLVDFVAGRSITGRDWADDIRLPDSRPAPAADAILASLPGWMASTSHRELAALLSVRALQLRQFHLYAWDFSTQRPDPDWSEPRLPDHLRIRGLDGVTASDLDPVRGRAYPVGHIDHAEGQLTRLTGLLRGSLYGPVLACSKVALAGSTPVAAALVAGRSGLPAWPAPSIVDLFRDPRGAFPGIGALLLRSALAQASADGTPDRLLLTVTEGNPAQRLYERTGFTRLGSARCFLVPS
ncbi:GNAT family N-acetyltransferase [Streptacidiphilus sp. N1-3]|uniref:GNAT family N-acetyltransferase n=1 Tax=Streptacidiphilus alkalitolerans TaxID=3342712 RepID=A0ABV6X5S4_9ACTN